MSRPVSCLHPDGKSAAVGGATAGLGGDRAQPPHGPPVQARGAGVQCAQRALHRDRAELTRAMQPLAEPNDAAEAVEHAEAIARGGGDQHAAVVGAEVERGE